MSLDISVLKAFYKSEIGQRFHSYIVPHVENCTEGQKNKVCLGIGYSDPYFKKQFIADNFVFHARHLHNISHVENKQFISDFDFLPIETNSLDAVFAIHGAELQNDPLQVFTESERVLKSDGIMLAVIPSRSICSVQGNLDPFNNSVCVSKQSLIDHVCDLGFSIEFVESYYIFSGIWGRLFARICRHICSHGAHLHVLLLRKKIYATSDPGGGTKIRAAIPKLLKNAFHWNKAD